LGRNSKEDEWESIEVYIPLSSHMIGVELAAADKVAMRDILLSGYPSWPAVQSETGPWSTELDANVGALKSDVLQESLSRKGLQDDG
jgi:hypothetical protein